MSERHIFAHVRFEALRDTLAAIHGLPETLAAYEATGDHQHDGRPLPPGVRCAGGDCLVARARAILNALGCVEGLMPGANSLIPKGPECMHAHSAESV